MNTTPPRSTGLDSDQTVSVKPLLGVLNAIESFF